MLPLKTLANSHIPLVFIIDLFAKKTHQIEACISPKLQFDEFFGAYALLFTNICKKKLKKLVKSQQVMLKTSR